MLCCTALLLSLAGCRQVIVFADNQEALSCDVLWYGDADGDGYGGMLFTLTACDQPEGYVDNADDCDDLEPTQNPSVEEICGDGLDNNCDGVPEDQCFDLLEDGVALYGTAESEGGFEIGVGDVNGDGIEDILLGTPNATVGDTFDGGAALFLGPHDGDRTIEDADVRILGEASQTHVLGYAVDIAGDLDGDGLDDIVITGTQIQNEEAVYTGGVSMFSATTLLAAAEAEAPLTVYDGDVLWFGLEKRDYLGASLSTASIDDTLSVFAGASGRDESRGAVYLLSDDGTLPVEILGEDIDDRLGLGPTVAGGDFNGDGLVDVFVGAHLREGDVGTLYACFGPLSDTMSAADCMHISAENDGGLFGKHVVSAGDVDGDGLEDLWVSAPSFDGVSIGEGTAYLLAGRTDPDALDGQIIADLAQARIAGLDQNDQLGSAIAQGMDIDDDGFADTLVSAAQLGVLEQGVAMLLYGPLEGDILSGEADRIFSTASETDHAGAALAFLSETKQLLVDTPESDLGANNGGSTWLFTLD